MSKNKSNLVQYFIHFQNKIQRFSSSFKRPRPISVYCSFVCQLLISGLSKAVDAWPKGYSMEGELTKGLIKSLKYCSSSTIGELC